MRYITTWSFLGSPQKHVCRLRLFSIEKNDGGAKNPIQGWG